MSEFLSATAELAGHITVIAALLGTVIGGLWAMVNKPWVRVNTALQQVDTMAKALGPNGGASLADEIRRQGEQQRKDGEALLRTAASVDALCDVVDKPIFRTDARGHWTAVNRPLSTVLGHQVPSILGMGWVSLIHQNDREPFLDEWQYAIADRRAFRRQVRLLAQSGTVHEVLVMAQPALHDPEASLGWFGTLELLEDRTTILRPEQIADAIKRSTP